MDGSIDGWLERQMDEWMGELMDDRWMGELMDGQVCGWMAGRKMDTCTDRWTDRWMDGQTHGRKDG